MVKLMIDDRFDSMPWDTIDAVVFDVGNVLLRYSAAEILKKIIPERSDLHARLLYRVYSSPYWVMRDRGSITMEEAAEAMSGGDEEFRPYVERALHNWWDLPEIEEGVEAVKRCKAAGKKLYVLSNYMHEAFAHAEQTHDVFKLFDEIFVSARINMVKPDQAIFRYVTEAIGVEKERILFIDDSIANIEAALDFGWQCLRFTREGQLRDFLAK